VVVAAVVVVVSCRCQRFPRQIPSLPSLAQRTMSESELTMMPVATLQPPNDDADATIGYAALADTTIIVAIVLFRIRAGHSCRVR